MLRKLDHRNMGKSNLGWLNSIFHFSFAEYFNIDNMNFGVLRVINDDLIASGNSSPKLSYDEISNIFEFHFSSKCLERINFMTSEPNLSFRDMLLLAYK